MPGPEPERFPKPPETPYPHSLFNDARDQERAEQGAQPLGPSRHCLLPTLGHAYSLLGLGVLMGRTESRTPGLLQSP